MDKAQMIQAIIGAAVRAATIKGEKVDTTDMFFALAFRPESELTDLCQKIGAV